MDKTKQLFEQLCRHVRETALLESTLALLEWDQQTKLPEKGADYRSEQVTFLSGQIHNRRTAPELGQWLGELSESELASDRHSETGASIRILKRDFEKSSKLPRSLVEELARAASVGQNAWVQARKQNDFKGFAPQLKRIFELKRQEAEALGYEDVPYDALLDQYEPEATTKEVAQVLESLRTALVPMVAAIKDSGVQPPTEIVHRIFPTAQQTQFVRTAAEKIGFDFSRGRLDVTHHPFCTETGPDDCRLATRYDERFFSTAFFGTLHEAGHGIYEQGLRGDYYGLPPGKFCSLGIHESQSRLWENLVGRSISFWQHFYPQAQELFPVALQNVPLPDFYQAINAVAPSLIRVEADEATYNLHVIIRFQLEQAIVNGQLETEDLPAAWNEAYRESLGIEPPNDADGVLQDVHWSAGLVGYFPTYSLGNLYASQFFDAAAAELGDLHTMFRAGDFQPLRSWLNTNVHQPGQCYSGPELGEKVTGQPLTHQALITQLHHKLAPIYGL